MTGDWRSLLTQLPPGVLSGLSSRILTRIPKIHFGQVLSEEELAKISKATTLSASESQLLVDSLVDFFRSAAFASKRPAQLTKELRESAVDIPEEQLDALTEVWAKEGAGVVRAMKSESSELTGGSWVENLSWELGVSLAASSSSSSPSTPACKAVLNFDLRDSSRATPATLATPTTPPPAPASASSTRGGDRLSLEFDHSKLYEFYLTLETIQERMDALGK